MAQADIARIAKGLGVARAKRERGQALAAEARNEIATLAREGLDERMTKVEISKHAGINRLTLDAWLDED